VSEAVVYRGGMLADGRSDRLSGPLTILVDDGRIAWIRPADDEGAIPAGADVLDASGSTIVPGLIDCHSLLTLPGGAHWIERIDDPPQRMLEVAEHNARLQGRAGIRWARDVGAPVVTDPIDGRHRALNLGVRDRWRGRAGYPYVRAAGSWLDRAGTIPGNRTLEARDGDELLRLAMGQLDDGADFLKLYLDGPEQGVAPWSADEVRSVVAAAHARGARVTAHSGDLAGARVCVAGGVDSIEHGFELDGETAAGMAAAGIVLVSTLTIFGSWRSFASTTRLPRFTSDEGRARIEARRARAIESVRLARAAGVAIATGTDFGGGSARANQLAWEIESLVEAGLEPWEALGAATWRGGELLGEAEAGIIHEGGPADFSLVHGDPLSDPRAMWRVWRVAWLD
jgi:imidazolonepropionase-like amidohydrolase